MKNRESQFKYQSLVYNVQGKPDVDHIGIKMQWNKKLFLSLNVSNGKSSSYVSKDILRHYHHCSDPKLGPGIVVIRRIRCNCHACTKISYLSWDSKIKGIFNQPR